MPYVEIIIIIKIEAIFLMWWEVITYNGYKQGYEKQGLQKTGDRSFKETDTAECRIGFLCALCSCFRFCCLVHEQFKSKRK